MNTIKHSLSWIFFLPLLLLLGACGGEAEVQATEEAPAAESEETAAAPEMVARLNINTATEEEMLGIPDVGDRMIREFEEYRPYTSIEQFRREIGKYVDEEQVAAYERYIFVPVSPNESDAATLQQLPGVDANEAQELITGRPYASQAAFMEKLASYVSEEELATAETYLVAEG